MQDRPTDIDDEMDASDDEDDDDAEGGIGRALCFIIAVIIGLYVEFRPVPSTSFAGGGWATDWETALRKSNQSGKRALVLFNAKWCPGCYSFEHKVLARPDVRQYLESRYTLIVVDMSAQDARTKAIGDQYNVEVYPTLILYNRGGTGETARCYGLPADELILWLRSEGKAVRQFIEPRGTL